MSEFDEARAEEFAGRMTQALNGGFVALMASIGHQTGLFDGMAKLAPSTSEEIAAACELNERYVREWLGAMVAGGVVEYDAGSGRYSLPAEHAASLTRSAGPANIATVMQFLSCMGEVETKVADCFRRGGGLSYADYERFHDLMGDVSNPIREHTLVQSTLPLVPGLIENLERGIDMLDVGCGSGHAINLLGRQYPKSRFWGYDFSEEAIDNAAAAADEWGLSNVNFECRDVVSLADGKSFDFVTAFDSIHDQAEPRKVLRQIREVVRPGGSFLMVDIQASSRLENNLEHPISPYMYAISTMHCMSVSLGQGGEGLGAMWGQEKARELLNEAGFPKVDVKQVEGDIFNFYYVCPVD